MTDQSWKDDPSLRDEVQTERKRGNGGAWAGGEIPLRSGKEYALEKIEWLWPGWLAKGKFHVLAGQKAAGKSTIAFDLSARLSCGSTWPSAQPAPAGSVIIWSGEDGISDTILPRFVAAGGDLGRIFPIKDIVINGQPRSFDPSSDMPALIEVACRIPDLALLIIDPLVMALPAGSDSHKNSETRRGLQPLVEFAESRSVALLGVTHFSKGTSDRDPVERITGSLAFGAVPRLVWGAAADDDGGKRRLVRIASNIGPTGGGFEYLLYQSPLVEHGFAAQRIDWGCRLSGSARELLNTAKQSAQAGAAEFLSTFLANGGKPQREVKAATDAYGHAWATVRLAQQKLGIKPKFEGTHWLWALPERPSMFTPDC